MRHHLTIMTRLNYTKKVPDYLTHPWVKAAGIALILFSLGIGVRLYHHAVMPIAINEPELQVSEPKETPVSPPETPDAPTPIRVQLTGAVSHPGIYTVLSDTPLITLIKQAGGLAYNADISGLNLSQPAQDGQAIQIPYSAGNTPGKTDTLARDTPQASNSTLSLNSAMPADLERLPGVGPATAQRIIKYREANGPFQSPEDLTKIKGIGPKKFAKLAPFVRL